MGKVRDFDGKKQDYKFFDSGQDPQKCREKDSARIDFGGVSFHTETIHGVGIIRWSRLFLQNFQFPIVDVPPKWSEKKKKYVYNFGGQNTMSSVKNTQMKIDIEFDTYEGMNKKLLDMIENRAIVFQLGKSEQNTFHL